MVAREPERTPLSIGVAWAARITSLGLEFVIPAVIGGWLDGQLGSKPWGLLIGSCFGFAVGILHLVQIARPPQGPRP